MLRKLSLLVKQYGFRTVSTDEKAIAFTSPVAFVRVWREPQSYEIGLDLGLSADADEKFYSSDLIGLYEPALQRRFQAADEEGTIFAVKRLAQVLREHGDELLRGNSFAYKRLRDEQVRSS
ncbi:MAG TPA: hypothetical protein VGS57_13005, partial [Thermoanaerobaculia bacterium]|nr:hypothetical protein [Thermoanaerobaculia bacterium]